MPAAFDEDQPPERQPPPPPPPYQGEIRDDNLGTIFKIGGSTLVATCFCGCGAIFLIVPLSMLAWGFNPFGGLLILLGLGLSVVGCYALYYGWQAADEGSKW
jgi:hypothetical protein